MTPTAYTYEEAMKIVEKFMEDTGIRYYCENYCKGHCCSSSCEKPCYKTKKRRISCSIFICCELRSAIFTPQQIGTYHRVHDGILYALLDAEHRGSEYFKPHLTEVKRKFRVPKERLDELYKLSTIEILDRISPIENLILLCKRGR